MSSGPVLCSGHSSLNPAPGFSEAPPARKSFLSKRVSPTQGNWAVKQRLQHEFIEAMVACATRSALPCYESAAKEENPSSQNTIRRVFHCLSTLPSILRPRCFATSARTWQCHLDAIHIWEFKLSLPLPVFHLSSSSSLFFPLSSSLSISLSLSPPRNLS